MRCCLETSENYKVRAGYPKPDWMLENGRGIANGLGGFGGCLWAGFLMDGLVVTTAANLGFGQSPGVFVPLVGVHAGLDGARKHTGWAVSLSALREQILCVGDLGGLGIIPFARKCRNCGLRKWQCDDISDPAGLNEFSCQAGGYEIDQWAGDGRRGRRRGGRGCRRRFSCAGGVQGEEDEGGGKDADGDGAAECHLGTRNGRDQGRARGGGGRRGRQTREGGLRRRGRGRWR